MVQRIKRHLILPLLGLGLTIAMSAPVQAQYHSYQQPTETSGSIQITFGRAPRWSPVRGSRVQMVRADERPDYDMFRYGGSYYVYRNDTWYMSRRGRGQFVAIDERYVPMEVSRVPRTHWRNYPGRWDDNDRDPRRGNGGRGNGYGDRNDRRGR